MTSRLNFSLTQLEYILAVNKHGHFAKAAKACQVTQPTLSMQIQKLEEDLNVVLFDRSKKPILLTEAGKKLISQFQAVLSEAKKIPSLIEEQSQKELGGTLSVGIIPTLAPYILPLMLPTIEKKYPDISLDIFELQTHQIIDSLNEDQLDVGILATPLGIAKIYEHPLFYEPFSVLSHKDHELSRLKRIKYSSLKGDDIWLLKEGHCLRNQVLDVCSIKTSSSSQRKFHFESGSLETLKNLVNNYGGYTLIPALASGKNGSRCEQIPFERPIPARQIGLAYRREHFKAQLIEALAEATLDSIPEEIRKIRPRDLDVLPVDQKDVSKN